MKRRHRSTERSIILNMGSLQLQPSKTPHFYKNEAISLFKRYNASDPNFRHFFFEFVKQARLSLDVETLRETVSDLQRYLCQRINDEASDEIQPLRNKLGRRGRQDDF